MNDLLREQHEREVQAIADGVRRYENRKASGVTNVRSGQELIAKAQRPMAEQLKADRIKPERKHRRAIELLADVRAAKDGDEPGIDVYALAEIAARFVINAAYNERALTPAMEALGRHIGRAVQAHVGDATYAALLPKMFSKKTKRLNRTQAGDFRRKSIAGELSGKERWAESIGNQTLAEKLRRAQGPDWSDSDYREVGAYLIHVFVKSTKLVQIAEQRKGGSKTQKILKPVALTSQWLNTMDDRYSLLHPKYSPMVSEPLDWTVDEAGILDGGYLDNREARVDFVKSRPAMVQDPLNTSRMGEVFDAVNTVQRTPWAINGPVLGVMRTVWRNGTGVGKVPAQYYEDGEKPLPPMPEEFKALTTEERRQNVAFRAWKLRRRLIHTENTKIRERIRNFGYRIAAAEDLEKYPSFYQPHKLDWRQRIYAVSTILSPQGNQFDKGLIRFAEGKRMGESADSARWLAIHGANLYGVDKVPFDARVAWVEENEAEILAAADDPLHNQFWAQADGGDNAWTFLAFCFEWAGYKAQGVDFETHLPVALDGSNSGLQHFSALTRDAEGARLTNVSPNETPEDLYTTVAESLSDEINVRASSKIDDDRRALARVWRDAKIIDRRLTKQPAMTYTYGNTNDGVKSQIMTKLEELGEGQSMFDGLTNDEAARYLAPILRDVIAAKVPKAAEAMQWLSEVAKVYSKSGIPLRWITPTGLPVVSRYLNVVAKRPRVYIDGKEIRIKIQEEPGRHVANRVNSRKQAASIAPNFVHSLDSSHLVMTVNQAREAGITDLAVIHDSFGTHAAATTRLSTILRDAFVRLYEVDRLREFRDGLVAALAEEGREDLIEQLPEVPGAGSLDIEMVRDSLYAFA